MKDLTVRGGERAIAAADWETARACLERAREEGDSPDALTGLSKVAMIEREYERAIELRERAFDLYKAAGQLARASDSASWLTFMYATYHGNFSAALGWPRPRSLRHRRDLLPTLERVRGGARRAPRDGLAVDARSLRRVDRLRAADLPYPLRRDPRRSGPLGRGRTPARGRRVASHRAASGRDDRARARRRRACVRAGRVVCRGVGARRSDMCAGAGAADRDPARDRG